MEMSVNKTSPKSCVGSCDTFKTTKIRKRDNATPCMINISAPGPFLQDNHGLYQINDPILCVKEYAVGSKSFRPDQLFKVTEIQQLCYFSTQSPFISTRFSTDTLTSSQMALYIPHSIFHSARLLYVRPQTFGPPYYVYT